MPSTDADPGAADRAAIAAFFHEHLLARRDALLRREAGAGFGPAPAGGSCFCAPVVTAQVRREDFELPAIESPEVFAAALLRLWRDAGVELDAAFAQELAALAARLKSDETFEDEPPPFIYTL